MAVQNGLDVRCYVVGRDISGSANALNNLGYDDQLIEDTPLNLSAISRLEGLTDGHVSVNAWFDDATDEQHDAFLVSNSIPTGDVLVMVPLAAAIGDPSAMLNAKQSTYNIGRQVGQAIAAVADFMANDFGLEFGEMLTAHDDTHSSASTNASVDGAASSSAGAIVHFHLFSLGSGTVTPVIQDSADNSSFAAITGMTLSSQTARAAERVASSTTQTIRRYVRAQTTGTFTNAKFAMAFQRG